MDFSWARVLQIFLLRDLCIPPGMSWILMTKQGSCFNQTPFIFFHFILFSWEKPVRFLQEPISVLRLALTKPFPISPTLFFSFRFAVLIFYPISTRPTSRIDSTTLGWFEKCPCKKFSPQNICASIKTMSFSSIRFIRKLVYSCFHLQRNLPCESQAR